MRLFEYLFSGSGIAPSMFALALVLVIGISLSKVKIKGWSLGVTWVLFTAIAAGHLGLRMDPIILKFVKEAGMVLFIYAIGMLVGSSFFSTFRSGGVQLNLLSVAMVGVGLLTTYLIFYVTGTPIEVMMGILSGAVTNTPALGAVQETVQSVTGEVSQKIGIGYALAYPIAILGLIITNLAIKYFFRIDVEKEEKKLEEERMSKKRDVLVYSILVTNPSIFGKNVYNITKLFKTHEAVISRIHYARTGRTEIVTSATEVNKGDHLLVVSKESDVDLVCTIIGPRVEEMDDADWGQLDSSLVSHQCLVTRSDINGKSIGQLKLRNLYNVNISRVHRTGLFLVAEPDLRLQIGDSVIIVGKHEDVMRVEKILGNSVSSLRTPNLLVVSIGIFLGIILGSIPIVIPNIPFDIKLGLSGGTLIAAILISNFGTRLRLNIHNTTSAKLMLRDLGISLFLACVGLDVGSHFVDTLLDGGYIWMIYAAIITLVPLWVGCVIGRYWLRLDYFTLLGYMAGNLTFAPALSLTADASRNNIASVKYASIYPLTMFLRVITAQWMLMLLL